MIEAFGWVIRSYGQEMVCRGGDGEELGRGMAILRPMTGGDWQDAAGALGRYRQDRFLALAQPGLPLDRLGPGGWLEWGGGRYEVMTARPVWVGGQVTHLWLALRPIGGGRAVSGALCGLREAVAGQLRRGGLPAVAAMEGRRAGRWRETVAAVSLSRVACAPGGFQDYLGVWTDPDSGKKREVYGRQAEITLTLDVYAPREGGESACQRGAETAAELLMCQGAAGLAALELRWGPVEFREELGMYRLPVSCRCGAWLTARTDGETGVFTDFEVKGRTI